MRESIVTVSHLFLAGALPGRRWDRTGEVSVHRDYVDRAIWFFAVSRPPERGHAGRVAVGRAYLGDLGRIGFAPVAANISRSFGDFGGRELR